MEETDSNLFQMMGNAGRNLALLAMEMFGEKWDKSNVVVLAGLGRNCGMESVPQGILPLEM